MQRQMQSGTVSAAAPGPAARNRMRIGEVPIDVLRFGEAVDEIARLVAAGRGAGVFTPNVDHIVQASEDPGFRQAYQRAALSVVDGKPVQWVSRLYGTPLPEKISGSDLMLPLVQRAAREGWRVFLLGGGPGVAEEAARAFEAQGAIIAGTAAPRVSARGDGPEVEALHRQIEASGAQLILVALGAPKQELLIDALLQRGAGGVYVGIGASLDFVTGRVQRAPAWMSRLGFEWLYRLAKEPRRLWRRYLVRDPAFLLIVARQLLARRRPALTGSNAAR